MFPLYPEGGLSLRYLDHNTMITQPHQICAHGIEKVALLKGTNFRGMSRWICNRETRGLAPESEH